MYKAAMQLLPRLTEYVVLELQAQMLQMKPKLIQWSSYRTILMFLRHLPAKTILASSCWACMEV